VSERLMDIDVATRQSDTDGRKDRRRALGRADPLLFSPR
jgi:hypothetical protein